MFGYTSDGISRLYSRGGQPRTTMSASKDDLNNSFLIQINAEAGDIRHVVVNGAVGAS